jgi:hypothetical protein
MNLLLTSAVVEFSNRKINNESQKKAAQDNPTAHTDRRLQTADHTFDGCLIAVMSAYCALCKPCANLKSDVN